MANDPTDPAAPSTDSVSSSKNGVQRRDFIKTAGAGAGLLLLGGRVANAASPNPELPGIVPSQRVPFFSSNAPDIVVIGSGGWGAWTGYHLRQRGAKVTVVDAYGPGNARQTSGDETRGVRSSYGDRDTGEQWMLWAREAMKRWTAFDDEWGREMRLNLFHKTGDLMFRQDWEPFLVNTKKWWDKHNIPYEVLHPADVAKQFPVISMDDINVVMYEPDAGVVRARRGVQAVSAAFERLGGKVMIGHATPSKITNGRLDEVTLDTGYTLRAETFVFCPGPWMAKDFPELFANKMRTPLDHVCYFATPVNDERFTYPNMPSFNFPGVTGWAALPVDNCGFRVRGRERAPTPPGQKPPARGNFGAPTPGTPPEQLDPDLSDRYPDAARIAGTRAFVAHRFPILAKAGIAKVHMCHYELSSSRNFIIDHHPQMANVLIGGGGNAEGFKFGPVVGDYIAQRALGVVGDEALAKTFRIPDKDFPPPTPTAAGPAAAGAGKSGAAKK